MKTLLRLACICCLFVNCTYSQNTTISRKYFFGKQHFAENGCELVLITRNPQTKLAEEIGNRIYSDSVTLTYMENNFYKVVDGEEIYHYCDFDLYFYIRKGEELVFWRSANSRCGISEIGGGNKDICSNIEFLAENGTTLVADTIRQIPPSIRTKEEFRTTYFEGAIFSEFRDEYMWQHDYESPRSRKNAPIYYDGYIELTADNYFSKPREHCLREALSVAGLTIDTNDPRINWDVSSQHAGTALVTIYFTNEIADLYDLPICRPINLPRNGHRFEPALLIWHLPCKTD